LGPSFSFRIGTAAYQKSRSTFCRVFSMGFLGEKASQQRGLDHVSEIRANGQW
jgi:hypothetical protein